MKQTKPPLKIVSVRKNKKVTVESLQHMKIHFPNGFIVEVPSLYCTPEEWAERSSMDLDTVMTALYNRKMARHQFSPRGDLFVNVVEETRRLLDSEPWNR